MRAAAPGEQMSASFYRVSCFAVVPTEVLVAIRVSWPYRCCGYLQKLWLWVRLRDGCVQIKQTAAGGERLESTMAKATRLATSSSSDVVL